MSVSGTKHGVPGVSGSGDVFLEYRSRGTCGKGLLPRKFLLTLRVTTNCNLRCRYCYASAGKNQRI